MLEDIVTAHHKKLEEITTSQQGTGPYHPPEDPAMLDSTGPGSHQKSSVASTDHDGVVKDPTRYPVDDITAQENCEMHVEFINISVKVAAGYALPCIRDGTYHCVPIPDGYSIVMVDEVVPQYNELQLEFPAGEDRELTKLGEAKGNTILWPKKYIVLPDWTPPPPPSPQHPQPPPSPQHLPSPPTRQPSPQPPPSPPARQPSPQPPPCPARTLKRKGSTNAPASSATAPKKSASGSAASKKGKEPEIVIDPEAAKRLLRNLRRPPPDLPSDYERTVTKLHEETVKKPLRRARAKKVAQLGEQENQSCPPLKVVSSYNRQMELSRQYEVEAAKLGVTMVQYLGMLPEFDDDAEEDYPMAEVAYRYTPGQPLLRNPDDIPKLSTKMRRLHQWYMSASAAKVEYIILSIKEEHFFRGDDFIHVEMEE